MNSPFVMARFFAKTSLLYKSISQLLCDANVPPQEREKFIDLLKNTRLELDNMISILETAPNEEKNGTSNGA